MTGQYNMAQSYLHTHFFNPDTNSLDGFRIWQKCVELEKQGQMTISYGVGEMAGLALATYSRDYQFSHFCVEWDPFVENCRGVVFDLNTPNHDVVALGLIKLFNYGEGDIHYPSPQAANDGIVACYEKVDGSLGLLFFHDGKWKLTTRGGLNSDIAAIGSKILAAHVKGDFSCFDPEYTYLFEIVYPDNQIVVKYDVSELVYIARRHNRTGRIAYPHSDRPLNLPMRTVRQFVNLQTIDDTRGFINQFTGAQMEGSVVHYADGSAFKIKSEDYLRIHRARSRLTFNRVLESFQQGKSMEFKKTIEEELWPMFDAFYDDIARQVSQHVTNICLYAEMVCEQLGRNLLNDPSSARRELALAINTNDLIPKTYKRFVFLRFDGKLTVEKIAQKLDIKPTKTSDDIID